MKMLLALLALPLAASADPEKAYTLGSYAQPAGQTLTIQVSSSSHNARIVTEGDGNKEQTMTAPGRLRTLERRTQQNGSITYTIVKDVSEPAKDRQWPVVPGRGVAALTGKTATGIRDADGRWQLFLQGHTPTPAEALELAELSAFENRQWFTSRPVKIGDSWKFDPAFIRHLLSRDLSKVKLNATMTFRAVRILDGESTAVLALDIQSVGASKNKSGTVSETAGLNATGTLLVSLDTMLNRKLSLKGSLQSTFRSGEVLKTLILPFTTETTRSIAK